MLKLRHAASSLLNLLVLVLAYFSRSVASDDLTSQSTPPPPFPPQVPSHTTATSLPSRAPVFSSLLCTFQDTIFHPKTRLPPSVHTTYFFLVSWDPSVGLMLSFTLEGMVQMGQCLLGLCSILWACLFFLVLDDVHWCLKDLYNSSPLPACGPSRPNEGKTKHQQESSETKQKLFSHQALCM